MARPQSNPPSCHNRKNTKCNRFEETREHQFFAMDALLPVKGERQGTAEAAYYTYSWQGSLKFSLQTLARGVLASHVASGEALFHCIRDMQIRSGFPHPIKLARHTVHGLALFFDELLSPADVQIFFTSTLPQIARLALNLPILLQSQSLHLVADLKAAVNPSPPDTTLLLRLLRTQQAGMVLLRQELVASLLACSFLCLFPTEHRREEQLGRINFDKLFAGVYERGGKKKNENKLRCLLHYFDRVCNSMPQGTVSFERKVLPKEAINDAIWGSSGAPLCPITVLQEGCIEDDGRDCLQVDFANRLLGGGALGDGCVQVRASFISAILSLSPPPPPPFLSILFRRIVASGFRLKLLQSFVSSLPHQLDFELRLQGLD